MAREILFKAKRIDNGEWVEGLVACPHCTDTEKGVQSYYFYEIKNGQSYQRIVSADTLCQYTGLTDKNGNKIWENDVVKQYYVDWRTEFDYCVIESIKYVEDEARFVTYDEKENKAYFLSKHSVYEVIGNIFDNPELLGGGE